MLNKENNLNISNVSAGSIVNQALGDICSTVNYNGDSSIMSQSGDKCVAIAENYGLININLESSNHNLEEIEK